jgi:hypothetical protein
MLVMILAALIALFIAVTVPGDRSAPAAGRPEATPETRASAGWR